MGKFIDLTGQKFGKLTVIKRNGYYTSPQGVKQITWLCICDCGNETKLPTCKLRSGHTKSCGCYAIDNGKNACEREKFITGTQQYIEKDCFEDTRVSTIKTKRAHKGNISGVRGVTWESQTKKWRALIHLKGKRYSLGRFDKIEDAIKARKKAEEELFQPLIEEYESVRGGE